MHEVFKLSCCLLPCPPCRLSSEAQHLRKSKGAIKQNPEAWEEAATLGRFSQDNKGQEKSFKRRRKNRGRKTISFYPLTSHPPSPYGLPGGEQHHTWQTEVWN